MKRLGSVLLLVLLAPCAAPQEPQKLNVFIPLIAKAAHHHPTSITAESLVVSDEKEPVAVASLVKGADLPLELGILIDTSGSQRDKPIIDILNAMNDFAVDVIRGAEDKAFFLPFEAQPDEAKWIKKEELGTTKITVGIHGGTALYDALAMACNQLMGPRDWRKPTRRVLILISDGDDNLSHITHVEAESDAVRAGTVIFAINTDHSPVLQKGDIMMQSWAKATGGEMFKPFGKKDIAKVFASIREQMDNLYYLTYEPINPSKNSFRQVEVKPAQDQKLELSYARRYFWN